MRTRNLTYEKLLRNELNANFSGVNHVKAKPPLSRLNSCNPKIGMRLRDKVASLVQMQLRHHQSNQNFLTQDKETNILLNFDTDRKEYITIYINTKYDIVEKVSHQLDFKIVQEHDDWNILWIDGSINSTRAFNLKRNQKVNHFPGMNEISRKDKLQKNLKIMQRYFPLDYNIFPKTWSLPSEKLDIMNYLREQNNDETFIIKPPCSSQGRGIILLKDMKTLSVNGNTICQSYISNPFLIDGYKFDLRIYVLLTSCDPFRIYIYEEGLARFATCKYEQPSPENLDNVYMHLTNYSVQRNSEKFNEDEIHGTKRRSTTIYDWFNKNGYNAENIWKSMDDVIIKTIFCANNNIRHNYSATFPDQFRSSACFELLGFDIILDDTLKPYVLEVNHSPSLETETNLDLTIKTQLLTDIFNMITSVPEYVKNISDFERIRSAERLYWSRNKYISARKASFGIRKVLQDMQVDIERNEIDNKNGFRILYPIVNDTEKYQKFFEFNCENHRNSYTKYNSYEEFDNIKLSEIKKESLPTVPNKIKDMDAKLRLLDYSAVNFPKCITSSRNSNFFRQPNSNIYSTFRNKELIPNAKYSHRLLDNSTKSLKKILSQKKLEELSKFINNKKSMSDYSSPGKRLSLSYFGNKCIQLTRQTESLIVDTGSPTGNRKHQNATGSILHKVDESNICQPTSVGIMWESSLWSNKMPYISYLNLESPKKSPLTKTTNSSELKILNECYSYSLENHKIEGLLDLIPQTEYSHKILNTNIEEAKNCHEINDLAISSESIGFLKNSVNPFQTNFGSENLTSTNIYSNTFSDSSMVDKELENLFSTNFSICSFEMKSNGKVSSRRMENQLSSYDNDIINFEQDSEISDEFPNRLFSISEIPRFNTLFAAEIEEYPGLLLKNRVFDCLKYFNIPSVRKQYLMPIIIEEIFSVAKSFDNTKSLHLSEKIINENFKDSFSSRKCNMNKIKSFPLPTICQKNSKRKHNQVSINFSFENIGKYPNLKDDIDSSHEKNKYFSNTIVEIDPDMNTIHDVLHKNLINNSQNDNNNKPFRSEIPFLQKPSKEVRKNHLSIREFRSANENTNMKIFQEKLNGKFSKRAAEINKLKKRKALTRNRKVSHQRFSTFNLEPRYTFEQFNRNLIRNFDNKQNNITKGISGKEKLSIVENCNNISEWNRMYDVCEINISPSLMSHVSADSNQNDNLTISMDSNQNSSIVCQELAEKLNNSNNNVSLSRMISQESLYKDAVIMNKNSNHLFEKKVNSKDPIVVKYFKQSIRKIDHYVEMCMGNNSERYVQTSTKRPQNPKIPVSNVLKWYPMSSENQNIKLPDITIRNFNNIIHLLSHRKHKNKSFNLSRFKETKFIPQLPPNKFDSRVNNFPINDSIEKCNKPHEWHTFQKSESIQTNKSLICKYLKNVCNKNKTHKLKEISSTNRLCKILVDKTNNESYKSKMKPEDTDEYDNKLILHYVHY